MGNCECCVSQALGINKSSNTNPNTYTDKEKEFMIRNKESYIEGETEYDTEEQELFEKLSPKTKQQQLINTQTKPIDKDLIEYKYDRAVKQKRFYDAMYLVEEYSKHVNLLNYFFENGNHSLHYSVKLKNSRFTIFLLQNNVSVDIKNIKNGNTPLHCAVLNDDLRMAATMIKWKADVTQCNNIGQTPIDIAVMRNDYDIIELLKDDKMKNYYAQFTPVVHEYGVNNLKHPSFMKLYLREIKKTTPLSSVNYDANDDRKSSMKLELNGINLNAKNDSFESVGNHTDPDFEDLCGTINEEETFDDTNEVIDASSPHLVINTSRVSKISHVGLLKRKSTAAIEYVMNNKIETLDIYQKWIQKKNVAGIFVKRYLVIKDGYMLWNDKLIHVDKNTKIDLKFKKKWKGHVSLLMVKNGSNGVRVIKNKKGWNINQFIVEVINVKKMDKKGVKKHKTYHFKTQTNEEVSYWVYAFQSHIEAMLGETDHWEE